MTGSDGFRLVVGKLPALEVFNLNLGMRMFFFWSSPSRIERQIETNTFFVFLFEAIYVNISAVLELKYQH